VKKSRHSSALKGHEVIATLRSFCGRASGTAIFAALPSRTARRPAPCGREQKFWSVARSREPVRAIIRLGAPTPLVGYVWSAIAAVVLTALIAGERSRFWIAIMAAIFSAGLQMDVSPSQQ
jgi:hypothetical protein